MSETRLYAFLTGAAMTAALLVVISTAIEPVAAEVPPAPGTLAAAASTIPVPPTTTTTTTTTATLPVEVAPTAPADESIKAEVRATTTTTATTPPAEVMDSPSQPAIAPAGAPAETEEPSPPPESPTPATVESGFRDDYAGGFVSLINDLRASSGLAALMRSGSLDAEAKAWAKRMGTDGSLSHSNVSRLLGTWELAGENIGTGPNVSAVFSMLTGSSGHLGNMLAEFTHVGAGVWQDSMGRIWTVHLFAR